MIKFEDVRGSSVDGYLNKQKIIELDADGWRIVAFFGNMDRTITHGQPYLAVCQKNEAMVAAPVVEPILDPAKPAVEPRKTVAAAEAEKPTKPKKKARYGGLVGK